MNRIKLFLSILVSSLILISCSNSAGGISGSPNGSATQPQVPSNTKYSITLAEINAGGSAKLNKTSAAAGETVTVTYSADAEQHYTIGTISVTSGKQAVSYTDNSGVVTFKMPAGNVIVNISFKLIKKTVTFNLNGGSGVNSVSADYGTAISAPDAPEKENYRFVAWYSDSTLKNKYDFSTQVIDDIELYAKWQYTGALASKGYIKNKNAENDDEKYLAKTEEIYVMPENKAVVFASSNNRGVFRSGKNVKLSPFIMGKYEVTQDFYCCVMYGNEKELSYSPSACSGYTPEGENQGLRPVENITWFDAVYFCNELTKKTLGAEHQVYTITYDKTSIGEGHIYGATVTMDMTKKGYRLPMLAEWQFAAMGGDPSMEDWNYNYSGNETSLSKVGWTSEKTHEVGKKAPNVLGIYDMSGNVAEYCWDWFSTEKTVSDPVYLSGGPATGVTKINCGGGIGDNQSNCAVDSICSESPTIIKTDRLVGFRIVRNSTAE